MAWKKDNAKSPLAQPEAKADVVLPRSRRGRPPKGTVAAKARYALPKKANSHNTGANSALRRATYKALRAASPVDATKVMERVEAVTPVEDWFSERPTAYNPLIGRAICLVIASSDRGMQDAIDVLRPELERRNLRVPNIGNIYDWRDASPEFSTLLREARNRQGDYLVEQAMRYAKEPLPWMKNTVTFVAGQEIERVVVTTDNVGRSRLIVETIMRRAGQLNPQYRDKHEMDLHGPNPQLEALAAALLNGPAVGGSGDD